MDIRLLGPLEVVDAGRALTLGGVKQRALLAVLALRANRAVATDELIGALWWTPPATAPKVVQVYVSRLRKALGADRIVTRAPGYELRLDESELDLNRFERLLADAHGAESQQRSRLLREALALVRGTPLAEFEHEPFAHVEALRLAELRLTALEARIDSDLTLGRHAEVLPELESLVAEQPLRERLSAQRMLALYRCGRQAEALDQYQETRGRLLDELGLEPSPELQRLERAILVQDDALAPPAGETPRIESTRLPTGTVTFLFTDIEGSTSLLRRTGERYSELLGEHERLVRDALANWSGTEVDSQGDSFFAVFRRATDAVAAAVAAQVALASHAWPEGEEIRVRMGIHTAEPAVGRDRYFGLGVHRAARIMASAHGGQIVLSQATSELLADDPPAGIRLVDLGEHLLPDFERAERLYQVAADTLTDAFPPLRTTPKVDTPFAGREQELVEAAQAALARRHPFRRRLALAAALLAAGIAAVVAVLLARQTEGPAARRSVGANSVALVDPGAHAVEHAIAVGKSPGPMAMAPGRLWVGNTASTTLTEIDVRSRQVRTALGLPSAPYSLAAGEGALWIGNAFDGTVSRLDVGSGFLSRPFRPQPGSVGRLALATGFGSLWVGSQDDVVLRVDPDPVRTEATIKGVVGPLSLVAAGGSLWVIQVRRARVLRIDPKRNRIAGAIALAGIPDAIAAGEGAVWVLTAEDGKVWKIDPKTSTVKASVDLADTTVSPPVLPKNAIAAGQGSVWVASGASGRLIQIDPDKDEVVRTIRIGRPTVGVVAGEGSVWVSVR